VAGRLRPEEGNVDTTTLLIIIVIVLLLGGGGWYGRGRWY
jgi:LPXTG-motif cell wall-anchored protein